MFGLLSRVSLLLLLQQLPLLLQTRETRWMGNDAVDGQSNRKLHTPSARLSLTGNAVDCVLIVVCLCTYCTPNTVAKVTGLVSLLYNVWTWKMYEHLFRQTKYFWEPGFLCAGYALPAKKNARIGSDVAETRSRFYLRNLSNT